MLTPINHYLTIVNRNGILLRGVVVFIYTPNDHSIEVHILVGDEPDSYTYAAVYCTETRSMSGSYAVHSSTSYEGQWLCKGIFTPAQDDSAHAP